MEPKFKTEECAKCRFIGHFYSHDVYIHRSNDGLEYVARFGNDGEEYWTFRDEQFAELFKRSDWHADQQMMAIVAAVCCDKITPSRPKRKTMADVKRGVSQLAWDMVTDAADSLPDAEKSTAAAMALHAFYEARALLEQAEHRLAGAMSLKDWHDREQKRKDGANGSERLDYDSANTGG